MTIRFGATNFSDNGTMTHRRLHVLMPYTNRFEKSTADSEAVSLLKWKDEIRMTSTANHVIPTTKFSSKIIQLKAAAWNFFLISSSLGISMAWKVH
jgi:hypothetical protein